MPDIAIRATANNAAMGQVAGFPFQRDGCRGIYEHQREDQSIDGQVQYGIGKLRKVVDVSAKNLDGDVIERRITGNSRNPTDECRIDGAYFIAQRWMLNQIAESEERDVRQQNQLIQKYEAICIECVEHFMS